MYRQGRGRFYTDRRDVLSMVKGGGWVDIASALDIRFIVGGYQSGVLRGRDESVMSQGRNCCIGSLVDETGTGWVLPE